MGRYSINRGKRDPGPKTCLLLIEGNTTFHPRCDELKARAQKNHEHLKKSVVLRKFCFLGISDQTMAEKQILTPAEKQIPSFIHFANCVFDQFQSMKQ